MHQPPGVGRRATNAFKEYADGVLANISNHLQFTAEHLEHVLDAQADAILQATRKADGLGKVLSAEHMHEMRMSMSFTEDQTV